MADDSEEFHRIALLTTQWEALLQEEERLFNRACELDRETAERNDEKSAVVREWWRVTNSILHMHVTTRMQLQHDLKPYPAITLGRLMMISENLGTGVVPRFVEDAASRGRPLYPGERRAIAYAILYVEAAKRGEIKDTSPVKTVSEVYNVTRRAVQSWQKDRDRLVAGVRKNLLPDQLATRMRQEGEIYARIGRGAPSEGY